MMLKIDWKVLALQTLLGTQLSLLTANSITDYRLRTINRPYFGESIRPLTISEAYQWNWGQRDSIVHEFWPLYYQERKWWGGKGGGVSFGSGRGEYYDAFARLDSMGYLLLKVKSGFESYALLQVEMWHKTHLLFRIEGPKGKDVFWTRDGTRLVLGYTECQYEDERPVVWFYDIAKGNFIREMRFDSYDAFAGYAKDSLISVRE